MPWSTFGQTYTIHTVAGSGTCCFSGDGGPATSAQLNDPTGVAVDSAGNLYIADMGNDSIRKVSNGVITTVASGLAGPWGIAVDSAGNLYISGEDNRIRKVSNGVITTVAGNGTGGFSGDNGPATSAELYSPMGVAVDSAGNLYIADNINNRIRKVANGVITTVAGNGTCCFSGDGGPATSAQLFEPTGVAVDSAGNLYIEDYGNNRIRKVSNGVITTTVASGLHTAEGVAVDTAGYLYVADTGGNQICKVTNGVISIVAGNGAPGFSGDNGPATSAQLNSPMGVAVDSAGNVYIADFYNHRIRVLTPTGSSCTYSVSPTTLQAPAAGGGSGFFSVTAGSGCTWTATIDVSWITITSAVSGAGNGTVIYSVAANPGPQRTGHITVGGQVFTVTQAAAGVACSYSLSSSSDSDAAGGGGGFFNVTAGSGCTWTGTIDVGWITITSAVSGTGNATVTYSVAANAGPQRTGHIIVGGQVFTVTQQATAPVPLPTTYTIHTVAGNGTQGFSGDGGPATSAQLNHPESVAVDTVGNLYIADNDNNRIRKVSNGVITTVAGTGTPGFSGDNGPATSAQLDDPTGIAVDAIGNLYIVDRGNGLIRKVSNGVITTVAGTGTCGAGGTGDGGPATSAQCFDPTGIAVDSAGNLYITDIFAFSSRIRKVANGVITTVAGGGSSLGDGGPATSAQLEDPWGVAVDPAGNLYIADVLSQRIRKVTNGVITTIAGNGTEGFSGDNGPATSAQLSNPYGVAVDAAGNLYIADLHNYRIRKVANGVITTVAGGGSSLGDGGPATDAVLVPAGVAVDSAGNLYTADGDRIRVLTPVSPCTYSVGPTSLQAPASGGNLLISIQTTAACPWTVSGLPNWVTVSGASSGTGSGSVTLVVSPNSGTVLSVTISIAGASVTVTQPAAAPSILLLSTNSLAFAAQRGASSALVQTLTVGSTGTALSFTAAASGGSWLTVSPTSGTTPASLSVSVNPAGLNPATYNGTITVTGTNGAQGTLIINVTLAVTAPLPTINGVTNAASYASGAVSPGELVTLFGTAIGPATPAYATTDPSTGKLATTIGGVQVLFNGTLAPMIYASSTQVSAVVPYEMAPVASPSVWIKYLGQTSNVFQLTTTTTAPGLFTQNASGSGAGAILNQDNSVNGPGNRAAKGSIVQVYLTGEGQTSPPSVTGAITNANLPPPQVTPAPLLAVGVTINGQPALYVYAGEAPGLVAGMMQLNVQIPANAPSGDLAIVVSIGGKASQNGVTVSVQ